MVHAHAINILKRGACCGVKFLATACVRYTSRKRDDRGRFPGLLEGRARNICRGLRGVTASREFRTAFCDRLAQLFSSYRLMREKSTRCASSVIRPCRVIISYDYQDFDYTTTECLSETESFLIVLHESGARTRAKFDVHRR